MSTSESAITQVLKDVKPSLFKKFVEKWSNPKYHTATHHISCCQTLVVDGCWKIFRQKCAYEDVVFNPPDLPSIWTGCVETPSRGSYYCYLHKDSELSIKFNGSYKKFKPNDIRKTKLSILII